jgi:hypothetical protein
MAKKWLGNLPPRYRFALNPYTDTRWSKCPKCGRLTYMRKFPLLIHVDGFGLLNLGKTCRYCPKCEFIIAHQDDLEHILTEIFSESHPDVVGNQYLVIGTVEKKAWQKGMTEPLTMEKMWEHTADIKEHLVLQYEPGGWVPPDRETQGTPRKAYIRPPRR